MSPPGPEDYRLSELERRLRSLEERGSPATQRLLDRLDYEREVRKDVAAQLAQDIEEIRQTLTWGIRLFIGSVLLVVVGILVALATGAGAG